MSPVQSPPDCRLSAYTLACILNDAWRELVNERDPRVLGRTLTPPASGAAHQPECGARGAQSRETEGSRQSSALMHGTMPGQRIAGAAMRRPPIYRVTAEYGT